MNCVPEKLSIHPSGYKSRTPKKKAVGKNKSAARKSKNGYKGSIEARRASKGSRNSKTVEKNKYTVGSRRNSGATPNKSSKKSQKRTPLKNGRRGVNRSKTPGKGSKSRQPIWERLYSMAKPKKKE
jgi:hypothetical protein